MRIRTRSERRAYLEARKRERDEEAAERAAEIEKCAQRDLSIQEGEAAGKTVRDLAAEFGVSVAVVKSPLGRGHVSRGQAAVIQMEGTKPLLDRDIVVLRLGGAHVRLMNASCRGSRNWTPPTPAIWTVGDLLMWSRADLLCLNGFGMKSVQEVQTALKPLGLDLKQKSTSFVKPAKNPTAHA